MAKHTAAQKQPSPVPSSTRNRLKLPLILLAAAAGIGLLIWGAVRLFHKQEAAASPLCISEYMTSNGAYPDEDGGLHDWVELHNAGSSAVPLAGYRLAEGDNLYTLPDITLEAGGYLVVYCDGEGAKPLHAGFKLKADGGETLSLRSPRNALIDQTVTIVLEASRSAVRQEGGFASSDTPTPGYPNTEEGAAAFAATRTAETGQVVINEVMADNLTTWPDTDGVYYDYIEVRNAGDNPLSLAGYGLSNDPNKPLKYQFPAVTLESGETVLVFAAGKEYTGSEPLHAAFGVSKKGGDSLFLSAPNGVIIDRMAVAAVKNDQALLRQENGTFQVGAASPGQPNTPEGIDAYYIALDASRGKDLVISEAISRNTGSAPLNGQYYDWIELHNPTNSAISLSGYTLSDDPAEPKKFSLPDRTIPAGGYLLVYAGGGTVAENSSAVQANFKLNGNSVAALLYTPDGRLADGIGLADTPVNISRGRLDGHAGFFYFSSPTPNAANQNGARGVSALPAAGTTAPGVYDDVAAVKVSLEGSGTIYYTTDGSNPTAASKRYTGPLTLLKTTVIRAIAVEDGAVSSDILTVSYIINEHHSVDVVSLVSDPDNLFSDERGIYATGPNASSEYPYLGANFWKDWERDAHVELFSGGSTVFTEGCGVKIFGQLSRTYEKKSLKLVFRDCYGASDLEAKVFDSRSYETFGSLILRTSGQDRLRTIMKDVLTTSLVDDEKLLDVQAYRPVIVYINGEYWGMHYIREKINEQYLSTRYGVSEDSIDLLQGNGYVNAGSNTDYLSLIQYVQSHDLRQADAYAYVAERVDLQNYADYIIAEIYCGNDDTGNIRYFRSSEGDNKWRWILFDTDLGFQNNSGNGIWHVINPVGTGSENAFSTALISNLLKNDEFRTLFLKRWEYHMKNTFSTERVIARIDQLHTLWQDEAARNFQKWNPKINWEQNVEDLRTFARNRQTELKRELLQDGNVHAVFGLNADQADALFE